MTYACIYIPTVYSNMMATVRMDQMMLVPNTSYGASNSISKDTRRTARPTFNENNTLLMSSLQNFHTLKIQALHEKPFPPDFLLASGNLALVAGGILIPMQPPFFPFILQWCNTISSNSTKAPCFNFSVLSIRFLALDHKISEWPIEASDGIK